LEGEVMADFDWHDWQSEEKKLDSNKLNLGKKKDSKIFQDSDPVNENTELRNADKLHGIIDV
tara:strand:- start:3232 stop:3417 length:186 start_codon:yes stop_codon:yes gene_type:complete